MTPRIGEDFVGWRATPAATTPTLGMVDFSICPHLAPDGMPGNSMAEAEEIGLPPSRVRRTRSTTRPPSGVVDGTVDVVSEGNWELVPLGIGS